MLNVSQLIGFGDRSAALLPGEALGGGFYAGNIIDNGVEYRLIVAPKATGESALKQWKTADSAGPAATQNLTNGPAASSAMNSASYPAAQWCEALTIDGYTDWYLPARDEFEVAWRNLKPTADANSTAARADSAIAYTSGGNSDDVGGDTMGRNRHVGTGGTGTAYTSGAPAQTGVTAFASGGAEAFASGYYWTATEFSATDAWMHNGASGSQEADAKSHNNAVRAFRRVTA